MVRCLRKNFTRCQRRFLLIISICLLTLIYVNHKKAIHEQIHTLNDSRVINEIYPDRKPKSRNARRNFGQRENDLDVEIEQAKNKLRGNNYSEDDLSDDSRPYEADFGDINDLGAGHKERSLSDDDQIKNSSKSKSNKSPNEQQNSSLNNDDHSQDGIVESQHDLPHHNDLFPKPNLGIAGSWNDATKKFTNEQDQIVNEFLYAWNAYKKSAWGKDTLRPLSHSYETWFDMGLTILDSLDNLIIFGLKEEFEEATKWVKNELTFDRNIDYVNLFECTIRVLGGLLSAHTLSAEPIFYEKAVDIGDRLLSAWTQSQTDIPLSDINPYTRKSRPPRWGSDSSTSEVTTVQLEFRELALLTNDSKYSRPARKTSKHVSKLVNEQSNHHFVQMMINPHSGRMNKQGTITFGARTDSYYEYLLKQWIQSNGDARDEWLLNDYLVAMEDLRDHLIKVTSGPEKLTFVAELQGGKFNNIHPKMDHLVCFLPGTLALGHFFAEQSSLSYSKKIPEWHLELAEELARTCYFMYSSFETGLPPEIVYFDMDSHAREIYVKPLDAFSLLRPESVESWFYLYRITKKQIYRDYGWAYFTALKKYARVDGSLGEGFASVNNVDSKSSSKKDKMESFFMAETLKYLFLLFSDDDELLPLDKFVFNTEAHPMLIRNSNNDIMFES